MAGEKRALGTTRTEQEILDELAELCVSPGYIHAIAYLCFRDNTIKYGDELAVDDIAGMFSDSRLLRTEISTLIGLMLRQPVSFELPEQTTINSYIARSDALMHEIHLAMSNEWFRDLDPEWTCEPPRIYRRVKPSEDESYDREEIYAFAHI